VNREFYLGDWCLRAAAAKAGSYGHDAMAALVSADPLENVTVRRLAEGKQTQITTAPPFPAGDFPPVNAVWFGGTMYAGKTTQVCS